MSNENQNTDHVAGASIVFDNVTKRYAGQKKPAVDSLSFTIPAGEMVMLVGPSGCGKTTTLKMINRLHEPTSGSITIDGNDVTSIDEDELRRSIGYVIQGGSLFPHQTVAQNIATVPNLLKWDKKKIANRVDEMLDLVGLDPTVYRDRFPRELSGGQQQRVGVARGLAADPPVILMDEPFGAVDPITRSRLQDELMSIHEEVGKTIVCVTHDIDEAIKLGDRIVILREGAQIAQYDTPENILAAPANSFVEDFVGSGSGLKQLNLTRVSELDYPDIPVFRQGQDVAEVRRIIDESDYDYGIILDSRQRPVAWAEPHKLPQSGNLAVAQQADLGRIDHRSTLNDALDAMLMASNGWVVVTGVRDSYEGVLDFDTVTAHVQGLNEEARTKKREPSDLAIAASEEEINGE